MSRVTNRISVLPRHADDLIPSSQTAHPAFLSQPCFPRAIRALCVSYHCQQLVCQTSRDIIASSPVIKRTDTYIKLRTTRHTLSQPLSNQRHEDNLFSLRCSLLPCERTRTRCRPSRQTVHSARPRSLPGRFSHAYRAERRSHRRAARYVPDGRARSSRRPKCGPSHPIPHGLRGEILVGPDHRRTYVHVERVHSQPAERAAVHQRRANRRDADRCATNEVDQRAGDPREKYAAREIRTSVYGLRVLEPAVTFENRRWPELMGKNGDEAVRIIKQQTGSFIELVNGILPSIRVGFTDVMVVRQGSPITMDLRTNRVRVLVNDRGLVSMIPFIA